MATVKQGTLTGVPEVADWDKHLRPILKRRVHKRERRAANHLISCETNRIVYSLDSRFFEATSEEALAGC